MSFLASAQVSESVEEKNQEFALGDGSAGVNMETASLFACT